jgi:predicted  nucleic acid-binding Zn-ribbon protein
MGPTNVALVRLFQVDRKLREAQERLDLVSRNVRVQERKINELLEKQKLAQTRLRESQSGAGQLDLDLKTRDAHIEKLRTQQQQARNNKEYQTFLLEINTQKLDRGKVEEQLLKQMEVNENLQAEMATLTTALEAEQAKIKLLKADVGDRISTLEAELAAIRPDRDAALAAVPLRAREPYERLADHHEGEAMSPLMQPDRRREEYACGACNMGLVTDIYNKLHSRDDLVMCPSCKRILYIPDDLPPENSVGGGKGAGGSASKAPRASGTRRAGRTSPRLSQDQAVAKFLHWFPAGFRDESFEVRERGVRATAHQRWNEELGGNKAAQLLAENAIGEITRRADLVLSPLNMLNRFDKMALREALGDAGSTRQMFTALLPLLAADRVTAELFEAYAAALRDLPHRGAKVCTWPVATLIPFIARPETFIFVKGDLITDTAGRSLTDIQYDPAPRWPTYERILLMSSKLLAQLRPHGARDFIDVLGFMVVASDYAESREPDSAEGKSDTPAEANLSAT